MCQGTGSSSAGSSSRWGLRVLGLLFAVLAAAPSEGGVFGVPTNLTADGRLCTAVGAPDATCTVGASVDPPGWLVLSGPTASNSVGDPVHQMRFFIEVENRGAGAADETLDIRVFDAGTSGARDGTGGTNSTTRYQLFTPAGASLADVSIGNDAAATTQNRLARLQAASFVAANTAIPVAFTTLAAGVYELRVTVASGDEVNAFGVDVRGAAGLPYNVYVVGSSNTPDSGFVAGTVNGGTAPIAAASAPFVVYPYVTRGCAVATSNFDLDASNAAGAGATASIRDALGVTTALSGSGDQQHVEDTVTVEPTGTVSLDSNNYGLYTLTTATGTNDNEGIEWRVADFQGWNTNPLSAPRDAALPLRLYLPNGYAPSGGNAAAVAPVEPVFAASARVSGGTNPPQVGATTQYILTTSVSNPGTLAISNVALTVPFVTGMTFVSSATTVNGVAGTCAAETSGATFRRCTFTSVAAGAVVSYHVTVSDVPTATGARNLTGATVLVPSLLGSLTWDGTVATGTTAAAHGFQTGDYVTIAGAEQAEYDGLFRVTVVDATHFTYVPAATPAGNATGATILATGLTSSCPTTQDAPLCATYTPAYLSRTETLGPLCPLSVLVLPANVDLSITKTASPAIVTAGQDISYTLTAASSATSGVAQNVTLLDPLPANASFRSIAVAAGWTCTTPPVGTRGTVSCTSPTLATGASAAFTLVVRADPTATGSVTNTASVSSAGSDTNAANNTATATVTVSSPAGQADLALTKSDSPDPVAAGNDITYVMVATNRGPGAAAAPTFRDATPTATAIATFNSLIRPAGWSCVTPAVGGTGNITCTAAAAMPAGVSATFVLSVHVPPGATGTITNAGQATLGARIESTTTDPVPGNNNASAVTPIAAAAATPTCATPAVAGDGGVLTGVVNTYYPATVSAAAGATTITLGAARGATTPISVGDLLLVVQVQGASINTTNSNVYGDGVASDPANGWTALNSTGLYEFVRAASVVPLAGGTLTTSAGLVNAYTAGGSSRFQVVRVPQYATATLGSTLTAATWNGSSGGILAVDVAGNLDLGGATVSVSGKGFRGGGGRRLTGDVGTDTDYRNLSTNDAHGAKAEGVAGTPRYLWDETTNSLVDNGAPDGYANGDSGRGAPGNAGGGGSDGNPAANNENTGGGGGGGGGVGGKGGNAWNSQDPYGGNGGAAFPATAARLALGGGGGAGSRNDSSGVHSSGGTGGGLVLIRTGTVSGTGTIVANGSLGQLAENDGAGGGGAGGTILVSAMGGSGLTGLTALARGGRGGDAWPTSDGGGFPANRHGPGGGGAGGVVLTTAATAATDVTGGANGITTTALDPYGSTPGSLGLASIIAPTAIPGVDSGAECSSDLSIVKTSAQATPGAGQATYNLLVTNNGFRTATAAKVTDILPGTVTFSSASASQGSCANAAGTVTCALGDMPSGASALVSIVVTSAGGTAPLNTASVTLTGTDPFLANNTSSVGEQADLAVTLSATPDPVSAGRLLSYTAAVRNNGAGAAANAVLSLPLPPGTTFDSATVPAGWTCSTPVVGGAGTIRCTRATAMPSGPLESFSFALRVGVAVAPNSVIAATATVSSSNDPVAVNDASTTANVVTGSVVLLTRAHLRGIRVDPAEGRVAFATGWQLDTLGFNFYATPGPDAPAQGQPPLNGTPVRSARPSSLTPTIYRVSLPPFAGPWLWIEELETNGARNWLGPFRAGDGRLAAILDRLEARDRERPGVEVSLDGGGTAVLMSPSAAREPRTARTAAAAAVAARRLTRFLPGALGVRVDVQTPGSVRLTRGQLSAVGVSERLLLAEARVTRAGAAVLSHVESPGTADEAIVFDAPSLTTLYSAQVPFVVSWRGQPRPRVALTREGDEEWPGWLRVERSTLYLASAPLGTDPWLWDEVGYDSPSWPSFDPEAGSFALPALADMPELVPVRLRVLGYGPYRHELHAAVNGVAIGSLVVEGTTAGLLEGVVPRSALHTGPGSRNELTLSYASDAPQSGLGWAYLDHLDLQATAAPSGASALTRLGPWNPRLPALTGCSYLVITHPLFAAQAERLAELKRAEGRTTCVLDVERAYDAFSAATVEAEAVAAAIRLAASGRRLRYVLLFGDDTFDYRDDAGLGAVSYIPSLYAWDGTFGRVPSETRYADLDGDGLPDVAIGRLPAKTPDEATALVDKVERQATVVHSQAGRQLFLAERDDPTPGTPSFYEEARQVAATVGGSVTWADGRGDPAAARETLLRGMAAGAGVLHVFSHGAPWQWGNTGFLTGDDVAGVGGQPPALADGPESIVLTWTCESQMFTYLFGDSLNEALLLRPHGGAIATFGPAGIADVAAQSILYGRLYEELPRAESLGDAVRQAKREALAQDARAWPAVAGWNLLGDPALPLR